MSSPPRSGYKVIEAVDGTEGVAKVASDRPDLVLMDNQLPMLDGYGEKPCETVMSSNGTSGAPCPAYAQNFCMALAAYVREVRPIARVRRASGPTITVC
jgi:CheY-like chemotaxis protein